MFHKAIDTTGMSDQEMFDISLNHMRSQGEPAFDGVKCRYRYTKGEKTLMCAAGPFVDDDSPNQSITAVLSPDRCGGYHAPSYSRLLERLQIAHDSAAAVTTATAAAYARMSAVSPLWKPEEWLLRVEAECRQIAVDFNLVYREPE